MTTDILLTSDTDTFPSMVAALEQNLKTQLNVVGAQAPHETIAHYVAVLHDVVSR